MHILASILISWFNDIINEYVKLDNAVLIAVNWVSTSSIIVVVAAVVVAAVACMETVRSRRGLFYYLLFILWSKTPDCRQFCDKFYIVSAACLLYLQTSVSTKTVF